MIVGTRARPAASYAKDAPPVETPLRRDLAQRLADLRANGPAHKHPLDEHGNRTMPNAPEGREKPGDPPEQTGEVVKPQIPLNQHPRAYDASGERVGVGKPPRGGYSLTTGKAT